jgi:hypothetical protein
MGAVCSENFDRVDYVQLLGPPIRGVLLEKLLRHHAIDQQHRIHRLEVAAKGEPDDREALAPGG